MALATISAFFLTFASIVSLALGYRSDLMKARRGRFPAVQVTRRGNPRTRK
jgi:hypothetical protein